MFRHFKAEVASHYFTLTHACIFNFLWNSVCLSSRFCWDFLGLPGSFTSAYRRQRFILFHRQSTKSYDIISTQSLLTAVNVTLLFLLLLLLLLLKILLECRAALLCKHLRAKIISMSVLLTVVPKYMLAASHDASCPLVSHGEYVDETDIQTDRPDGRQTLHYAFPCGCDQCKNRQKKVVFKSNERVGRFERLSSSEFQLQRRPDSLETGWTNSMHDQNGNK